MNKPKELVFIDFGNKHMISWFLQIFDKEKFNFIGLYSDEKGTPVGALYEPIGFMFKKKIIKKASQFHNDAVSVIVDSHGNYKGKL